MEWQLKMGQQLESASTVVMVIESYLGLEADASGFEISRTRLHVIRFL
jgi:hypothetical protein